MMMVKKDELESAGVSHSKLGCSQGLMEKLGFEVESQTWI